MVIGAPPLGIAGQHGAAHAVPGGALGLVVLIAVVVAVTLSKRGK